MMKKIAMAVLITVLFPLAFACGAEEPPDLPPPPPPPPQGGNHAFHQSGRPLRHRPNRLGAATWRAFAALSEKERQELMAIQRSNPEEFRKRMAALGAARLQAEQAKQQELRSLAEKYRTAPEKEKTELREKISKIVREEYMERLNHNRSHLAEMKRRVAKMEQELKLRAAKADEAIEVRVKSILTGGR